MGMIQQTREKHQPWDNPIRRAARHRGPSPALLLLGDDPDHRRRRQERARGPLAIAPFGFERAPFLLRQQGRLQPAAGAYPKKNCVGQSQNVVPGLTKRNSGTKSIRRQPDSVISPGRRSPTFRLPPVRRQLS